MRNGPRSWGRRVAEVLDPSPLRLSLLRQSPPPLRLAMVYRLRNAAHVEQFLRMLPPQTQVRLWALDRVAPRLAAQTLGAGAGTRFELLNRLLDGRTEGQWTVLADDDVRFVRGSLALLAAAAQANGLDVVQPAHAEGSHLSQPITRRRLLVVAREVGYVEQGPLVLLSPRAQQRLLPLPEDVGMGWGIEYAWSAARQDGLRLAIVDAVSIRHLAPPGADYDVDEARAGGHRLREAYGFASAEEIKTVLSTWRPWTRPPPAGAAGVPRG